MNRRDFFTSMVGGVTATAAVRTWPFRVYSFPTDIQIARSLPDPVDDFLRVFTEAMRIPRKRGPFMPHFRDKNFGPTRVIELVKSYD